MFKKITPFANHYCFDKGLNLIQQGANTNNNAKRLISCQTSNRALDSRLYNDLDLTPSEKEKLNQTLIYKGIFDRSGHQLCSQSVKTMSWDYRGMLQKTNTEQSDGATIDEYNIYPKAGTRNRKITKKVTAAGEVIEITEAQYLGNLEYRTTWKGNDLTYDGEVVTEKEDGAIVSPYESYRALRIRQGHKQVATKKRYTYKNGEQVTTEQSGATYDLSDHLDSCSLVMSGKDQLESYESYRPYGSTAISYGKTDAQPYKFSGQEKDQSGLYHYGFRSLLSESFRWTSPDPAGLQGSGLNWYAMVSGNPITFRDRYGLVGPIYVFTWPHDNLSLDQNVKYWNKIKSAAQSLLNDGGYESVAIVKESTLHINPKLIPQSLNSYTFNIINKYKVISNWVRKYGKSAKKESIAYVSLFIKAFIYDLDVYSPYHRKDYLAFYGEPRLLHFVLGISATVDKSDKKDPSNYVAQLGFMGRNHIASDLTEALNALGKKNIPKSMKKRINWSITGKIKSNNFTQKKMLSILQPGVENNDFHNILGHEDFKTDKRLKDLNIPIFYIVGHDHVLSYYRTDSKGKRKFVSEKEMRDSGGNAFVAFSSRRFGRIADKVYIHPLLASRWGKMLKLKGSNYDIRKVKYGIRDSELFQDEPEKTKGDGLMFTRKK